MVTRLVGDVGNGLSAGRLTGSAEGGVLKGKGLLRYPFPTLPAGTCHQIEGYAGLTPG
jgi:hypothetical protein